MLKRIIEAENIVGEADLSLALTMALEVKNGLQSVSGFSPSQWVLGRNPRIADGHLDGLDDKDAHPGGTHEDDPMMEFARRGMIRAAAKEAWIHYDSKRRVRAAMLRQGFEEPITYKLGDMVAFMRKQKSNLEKGIQAGIKWYGPARVIAQEGKNVWLLHGGVPLLIGTHMVRPSNPEEFIEAELLGRKKSRKRVHDVIYDDVRQPHQLDQPQQQGFLDLRKSPDDQVEGESFEQILGISTLAKGAPPSVAPTGEDSPKRMRKLIAEEEEKENQLQQQDGGPAIPDTQSDGYSPTELAEDPPEPPPDLRQHPDFMQPEDQHQQQVGNRTQTMEQPYQPTMRKAPLQLAMEREGGNILDVGPGKAKKMRAERDGPYRHQDPENPDAKYAVDREFVCFLAKRVNKKKAATGEKVYRHETPEMQRKLRESRNKEWNSWKKYKAVRLLSDEEAQQLISQGYKPIPTRWVDLDKNEKLRTTNKDVEEKLKSRLVMRGDLEQGDFRVDCPTASSVGIHLLVSYTACRGLELKSGDITAAFLQGAPIQRIVILRAPAEGIPGDDGETMEVTNDSYMLAEMAIYGARDAPRGFWLELRDEIVKQPEVHEVTGEAALYAVTSGGKLHGYIATHVDDVLWCSDPLVDEVMERVQQRFTFGAVDQGSFRYCGRTIADNGEYIEITSPETLKKVKPIFIKDSRQRKPTDAATAEEQSQMRGVLGSLGWICRLCRPELSYRTSALQGRQSSPTVGDLVDTNKLLSSAQKTSDNGIRFHKRTFDFNDSVILSITDASHAAEIHTGINGRDKGYRSQGGRMIFLANKMPSLDEPAQVHLLEWSSTTLKRVCRSTLQAETLSSMLGSESAQHLRAALYGSLCPKPPGRDESWAISACDFKEINWLTDCRSLVDYMSSTVGSAVSDKRLAIDLTTLKQELWRPKGSITGDPASQPGMPVDAKDKMFWVSTRDMVCDALTKSMKWDAVRNVCTGGIIALTESARRALPTAVDTTANSTPDDHE